MERHLLVVLLLSATLCAVFASPLQLNAFQPNYDNIPQCLQPSESGLCLAFIPSYYYSSSKKTCLQFIYGGCGGNKNRFLTFAECMATCEGAEPENNNDFKLVLPSETIDPCSLPNETGPCRAGIPRFYFNGNACESFLYGGCEGNGNNFNSLEECQLKCDSKSSEENVLSESSENKSEEAAEDQVEPKSEEVVEDQSEPKSEAATNE